MGRLVRSRLKAGINMRRDSYFLVVSCTSLLLYAICLYTFLHLNGYIGAKNLVTAPSPSATGARGHLDPNAAEKNSQLFAAPYLKSQAQFDDGKIHEFQRNVGHPVDWEMRVKGNFGIIFEKTPKDNCVDIFHPFGDKHQTSSMVT